MLNFEERIEQLRLNLAGPLPGRAALMEMAPEHRRHQPLEAARAAGCREGAALVLLYPQAGEVYTVLTVRSAALRTHGGQISFPGGRIEPAETPTEAATREAWEELGIVPAELDLLGSLTPFYIPPSNFCLSPVVAATRRRPDFQPHDGEVAALIEAPVQHFVGPTHRVREQVLLEGEWRTVPYFAFQGHKIWGATAIVVAELAALWDVEH